MKIIYIVRHSRGMSWAVDEWERFGHFKVKNKTWYFPTEQEARDFKKKKGTESEEMLRNELEVEVYNPEEDEET